MSGVAAGVLIGVGAIAALVGAFFWSRTRKQFGWEAVEGTVRSAAVVRGSKYYRAQVEYMYTYRGRALQGTKVRSPTAFVTWPGPSKRIVAKYPAGRAVTVFVNPENPQEAVLERGGDPTFFVLLAFISLVFLIIGVAGSGILPGAPI